MKWQDTEQSIAKVKNKTKEGHISINSECIKRSKKLSPTESLERGWKIHIIPAISEPSGRVKVHWHHLNASKKAYPLKLYGKPHVTKV